MLKENLSVQVMAENKPHQSPIIIKSTALETNTVVQGVSGMVSSKDQESK
jgi:hypothetical protein